ncbi:hypothetical protein EYC84_000071 [Monilinia fructicola]|uniref:Uncharacterized protein n=1 Tax=Monilinia fructicola TaxID=38448 RepID=A0A5M9JQI8_MONFR|nr:hypothetical protein EYC84_000071 [Monilinia fructicola]
MHAQLVPSKFDMIQKLIDVVPSLPLQQSFKSITNQEIEALRIYELSFATKTSEQEFISILTSTFFTSLVIVPWDMMKRSAIFRTFLNKPELLDDVKAIAIDHVDVEVKRPWESYNKATLIRSFPKLDLVKLIIREEKMECGGLNEDFEFVGTEDGTGTYTKNMGGFQTEFL